MDILYCITHVAIGDNKILPTIIFHQVVGKAAFMDHKMVVFQVSLSLDAERVTLAT